MRSDLTRAEQLRITREQNVKLRANALRPERYIEVIQQAIDKRKAVRMG